jgi:hypothetical protein
MGISIEQYASIVPALEHTIVYERKVSDLYKYIPIATQCGLLSAHFCKRYDGP